MSAEVDELEVRRAEVLLGIATELRQAADMRAIERRRGELTPRPRTGGVLREPDFAAQRVPPIGVDAKVAQLADEQPTMIRDWAGALVANALRADPGVTQRLPITWSEGDRAECRHCRTPIVYGMWPTAIDGDPVTVAGWRHKYSGQVTCAVPATAGGLEGSEPTHTFAEPDPRG